MEENLNKKKKSFLPVLLIALVLLAVGGYFAYKEFFKKDTPKDLFVTSIEKTLNKTANVKEKKFNTLTDEFKMNLKVSSPLLDKNLLDIINKLEIGGKIEFDKKNNNFYMDLDTTYDNLDLLKLSAYLKDNAVYMMFNDALDKWIKVDLEDQNINLDLTSGMDLENLDLEKYAQVGEDITDALVNSLKDDYFKKDGSTITLKINNKNLKDILVNTLKELKKSKSFKELYKELNTESTSFEDDIDLIIELLKATEIPEDMGEITVSADINSKKEMTKLDITAEVSGESFSIVLEKTSDDTLEFAVKTQGVKMFSGSITSKEKNNKYTMNLTFSMMEMINIELNVEETIKYDAKLTKVDVSDSINSEDLTEADAEKLEKLNESKGMKKFIEDFEKVDLESMMGSFGADESSLDF